MVEEVVEETPAPESRASSLHLRCVNVAKVLDPLACSGDDTSDRHGRRSYTAHITHFSSHLLPPIFVLVASPANVPEGIPLRSGLELWATDR